MNAPVHPFPSIAAMSPAEILARTVWGEARGEGAEGMTAVANVIMNRVAHASWWGDDVAGVCLKPWQFSCWNQGDPNRNKLLTVTADNPEFQVAAQIAAAAIAGTLPDITHGATSYKVTSLPWPRAWGPAMQPVAMIGHQSFYDLSHHHPET